MNRITRPRFSIPMRTINKFARLMPEPSTAVVFPNYSKVNGSTYGLYLKGDPTRTVYSRFATKNALCLFIHEQLPEAFHNIFASRIYHAY